jgi:hypothetical protein
LDATRSLPVIQLSEGVVELALDIVEDLDMSLDRSRFGIAKPVLRGVNRDHTGRLVRRRHLTAFDGGFRLIGHAVTVADEPFSRATD